MAHAISSLASSMLFNRKLSLSAVVYSLNLSSHFSSIICVNGDEFQESSFTAETLSSRIRVAIELIPGSFRGAPSQGMDSEFSVRSQAADTAPSLKSNLRRPITHGRKRTRYFPNTVLFKLIEFSLVFSAVVKAFQLVCWHITGFDV